MGFARSVFAGLLCFGALLSGQATAYYEETFICESIKNRTSYCDVDTSNGVELVQQLSRSPCIEDQSWGYDHRGLWVSQGCRGEFGISVSRHRGRDYHGGYGDTIICESLDRRRAYCPVRIRRGAELIEQISNADCVEGDTWGYDRGGIWVSRGCRGEFAVE